MNPSLRELAAALGGDAIGNYVLCPGPGHSPKDRSLKVSFDGHRLRVHSFCPTDDWRTCMDYVQLRIGVQGLDTGQFAKHVDVQRVVSDYDRTQSAWAIWNEAVPIDSTPAELHMILRGLGDVRSNALRWHPACPYGVGVRRGCMLAAVSNIATNQFQSIQRTPLASDGERIGDRKLLGPSKGGAIKLTGEVMPQLAIGEGVETALSFCKIPGMAGVPIWSTIDANGMTAFPVLPDVRTLWVIADHDNAGKRAATQVSETWVNSNRNVFMLLAKKPGVDLNDVLRSAKYA